jgi:hypothetical protein
VGQILLFSLTAMANPTLVAVTTVMLFLENPAKLMLGYLLGALLTSITIGIVIVLAIGDSSAVTTTKNTVDPVVDVAIGSILLLLAGVLATGRDKRVSARRASRRAPKAEAAPPRWRRAIDRGDPRITFVVGALLTLPGASYLLALHGIVKLDTSTAASVLLVVMVNVIMLALLEVPLICFAVAPEWTPRAVERAKRAVARDWRRICVTGLGVLACCS